MLFKRNISISKHEDLDLKQDAQILQGDADMALLDKAEFHWLEYRNVLSFEKAYRINRKSYDTGIRDCIYIIRGRMFTDLSCMKGETIMKIEDEKSKNDVYELRAYPDGGKFIFYVGTKPIFDSGDREWDHYSAVAVYADEQGVNLIHCTHGYKIPRIDIYLGLKKAGPFFATVLKHLQCDGFRIET